VFLAIRKVDFAQMAQAFTTANYWYFVPAVSILFFSHLLRALRWRFLLDPIERLSIGSLFSALVIGYMANLLVPAHLGEILRAYVLSRRERIAMSSTFATIVMERIIDMFTLLVLMGVAILIYPFPAWVKNSGYILFVGTLGLFLFLTLLKKSSSQTQTLLLFALRPFPRRIKQKIEEVLEGFVSGIFPLKRRCDYATMGVLSLLIWVCYGVVFYLSLNAFDFVRTYQLPWSASLVLLVVTTIAIVIPSSPGYWGTYHYLCQISLALFNVPAGPGLSFAAIVHGINFLPILIVGLILSYFEGVNISMISEKKASRDNVPKPLPNC
jgi:uncharacterized protein (TIRG00374 family)